MAMKKIDLGPTGLNVARSVRQYRNIRNFTYAELSRRLDGLNRRIPPLGLRQLEAGKRRVDVDDLVALAVALDASPQALIFGIEPSSATLTLTGDTPDVTITKTDTKEVNNDGDD